MVRRLYIHKTKGKVWSRKIPKQFKSENGGGWKVSRKLTEKEFSGKRK